MSERSTGERVLVTGAAGFIGYHVSERLLDRGTEVIGLDNLNTYYDVSLKEARLARLEGRVSFEELLARMPDYALDAEPQWQPSPWARAYQSVPLCFDPDRAVARS